MLKYLFTYGTLKRGDYNDYLLGDSDFVCGGVTKPEFEMVSYGTYPAIRPGKSCIYGEVYRVTEDTLEELDNLELPYGYERTEIEVSECEGKEPAMTYRCICYVATEEQSGLIGNLLEKGYATTVEDGNWQPYQDKRKTRAVNAE